MSAETTVHDLPKQYEHDKAQARWYPFWKERGYFNSDPDPSRKPYTIVIPPPNVTGALHLGHALNNTLQDILIRWRRMQGYNTLWMPGTDHAGIATQAVVERRLLDEEKKTRHDLGRDELVRRIWAWKEEYEARILSQLEQLGCSCDWRRTRFTLDAQCARAVRHTFFSLFRERLIYRGKRLVNWDTLLQTAVSDDEVFHETIAGHFWHLRYPLIDPRPGEPAFVSIATTRPETMLGDTAVAVHPDPSRALDVAEAELRQKLSEAPEKEKAGLQARLDDLAARRKTLLPELIRLRDMARAGRKVCLPLLNREIPLVADEWAKPDLGSGCVKITPAHDPNDYDVARRQNLPMINILEADGTLNDYAGPYRGLKILEARRRVVADLEQQGLVEKVEDREIELAHSDRSKTPIEPRLADQWFVKMDRLAQSAMDAVSDGRVKIVPPRFARSYLDWLGEKRDWPVSRQLWWGHRIPIWYAPTASEQDLRAAFAGRDDVAWYRDEEHDQWLICAQEVDLAEDIIPGHKIAQDPDVLDTWFSSALWPHSTLGWPSDTPELRYYYPTSTLVTNRDILTLWVARMVLTGLHNMGDVPFRDVYIHPTVLDGFGERMSKSKGNGVDPLDVVAKFGADSLRFSLAYLTTETQDVRMPVEFECPHCHALIEQTKKNRVQSRIECKKCGQPFSTQWATRPEELALPRGPVVSEQFELGRNFCNKLWNASRFALINLAGHSFAPVQKDQLTIESRWVVSKLVEVSKETTDALSTYRYADAARTLYAFAWDGFCSYYVEAVKGSLRDPSSPQFAPARGVLAFALDTLLRLLHPFIPFLTEEIWQLLAKVAPTRGLTEPCQPSESVMIAQWPCLDDSWRDRKIETIVANLQNVAEAVRDVHSQRKVSIAAPLPVVLGAPPEIITLMRSTTDELQAMVGKRPVEWGIDFECTPSTVLSSTTNTTPPPDFAHHIVKVFVDMAGHIDVEAEIKRKDKELSDLDGRIAAKERQLANQNFVSRAPAEVIEKERTALAELRRLRDSTEAALESLRRG